MPIETTDETSIGVTAFKAQCLGLIDDVAQGKTSRIILTRHSRPIAPGVDLTEPTGEIWEAEK
jgi:antitoxin (DNA-binding transcriptional repressor) of toxin-antitoxin stability system